MKINSLKLLIVLLFISVAPALASSVVPNNIAISEVARVAVLQARIGQIQEMDKSSLSRIEKNELRLEVKSMDNELKELAGGGVYISVSAIIIILLLIILL